MHILSQFSCSKKDADFGLTFLNPTKSLNNAENIQFQGGIGAGMLEVAYSVMRHGMEDYLMKAGMRDLASVKKHWSELYKHSKIDWAIRSELMRQKVIH